MEKIKFKSSVVLFLLTFLHMNLNIYADILTPENSEKIEIPQTDLEKYKESVDLILSTRSKIKYSCHAINPEKLTEYSSESSFDAIFRIARAYVYRAKQGFIDSNKKRTLLTFSPGMEASGYLNKIILKTNDEKNEIMEFAIYSYRMAQVLSTDLDNPNISEELKLNSINVCTLRLEYLKKSYIKNEDLVLKK